jgi:hypothetical protein
MSIICLLNCHVQRLKQKITSLLVLLVEREGTRRPLDQWVCWYRLTNSFVLDSNSWYNVIFNKSSQESNLLIKSLFKKNPLKKTKPHKITIRNHVQKRKKTSPLRKRITNSILQTASFYYLASLLCLVSKPVHPKVS